MSVPITVNCPTCQKAVDYVPENDYRPFCSKRCQLIDLGVWADEGYSIPATPTQDDLEEIMSALEEGEDGDSDKPFLYQ